MNPLSHNANVGPSQGAASTSPKSNISSDVTQSLTGASPKSLTSDAHKNSSQIQKENFAERSSSGSFDEDVESTSSTMSIELKTLHEEIAELMTEAAPKTEEDWAVFEKDINALKQKVHEQKLKEEIGLSSSLPPTAGGVKLPSNSQILSSLLASMLPEEASQRSSVESAGSEGGNLADLEAALAEMGDFDDIDSLMTDLQGTSSIIDRYATEEGERKFDVLTGQFEADKVFVNKDVENEFSDFKDDFMQRTLSNQESKMTQAEFDEQMKGVREMKENYNKTKGSDVEPKTPGSIPRHLDIQPLSENTTTPRTITYANGTIISGDYGPKGWEGQATLTNKEGQIFNVIYKEGKIIKD